MNCERCKEPDADCLTRDGARVCQTCLYERVERERDLLREEVKHLRARVAELEHPMSYMPPSPERCRALLAIAQRERDEAQERIVALMKGDER